MKTKVKVSKLKLNDIEVVFHTDDMDISDLGEFTNKMEPGVIVRATGEFWEDTPTSEETPGKRGFFKGFKAVAGGEPVGSKEYKKYALQDWKRAESFCEGEWNYFYVVAKAKVSYPCGPHGEHRLETLSSGGLGGVESDCGKVYLLEIVDEQLADLKHHLKVFGVHLVGFSKLAQKAKEKAL